MGTPIPSSQRGTRAALLLRLATQKQLRAVALSPGCALLLAGAESGELLLFTTSNGALAKVNEGLLSVGSGERPPASLSPPSQPCPAPCMQRLAAEPSKSLTPVTCVAWEDLDGAEHVVAGHQSGTVRVWDVERGAGELLLHD